MCVPLISAAVGAVPKLVVAFSRSSPDSLFGVAAILVGGISQASHIELAALTSDLPYGEISLVPIER